MKITLIVIGAVTLVGGFISWTDKRDMQMMQAAHAYEECVQREYGMTPIQWYAEHHKYPLCGN